MSLLQEPAIPVTALIPPDDPERPDRSKAAGLLSAGERLLTHLARGHAPSAHDIRAAMEEAFGASDSTGAWVWKDAYEALEIAQLLFLRRFLPSMRKSAKAPIQLLSMLQRLGDLIPTHTRRSEDSIGLQQFSTPLELAFLVAEAAAITADDVVLEPSAGTGQLAIFAEAAGASLHLNELSPTRADILATLFNTTVTGFNAEQIHDRLAEAVRPTVIIMNPPFSASPNVTGTMHGVDLRHVKSALNRLAPGGRLVAMTSAGLWPHNPQWKEAFDQLSKIATLRYTTAVSGKMFQRHGTTIPTRLSVFDKRPAADADTKCSAEDAISPQRILSDIAAWVPARAPCAKRITVALNTPVSKPLPKPAQHSDAASSAPAHVIRGIEITYSLVDAPATTASQGLYQNYAPERIMVDGACPPPTALVQSTAMASVKPPAPAYRPHLPPDVIKKGLLSDAQLECVIYAGEAHARLLTGHWTVDDTLDHVSAATSDTANAVQFRRGFFIGDGTGVGKGRGVSGIILDNWIKGRTKAVWVSKSDTLLEDAQRDWSALEQEKLLIVPQSRFKQGKPIPLSQGILFTTYATLRSTEREGKKSRLAQITDWLGHDFDGVIIFDEAHAMGNAATSNNDRGTKKASQQGICGLRLQHALPNARVVYVSATGATTIENLSYAQRLGLWGNDDLPFPTRADFVAAMQQGGIASSEVLARDLKALGLYIARSLSYEGVEVDILEHALTEQQIDIYNHYARAYKVIHTNLHEALKASGISDEAGATLNKNAKSAALSAFEGNKQRFFNHLITAMKVPTLLKALQEDLDDGKACVIQLVSTSEALMERRLSQLSPSEMNTLNFDVTPREYVLDYLQNSFPTQLFETYSDEEGELQSRPVFTEDGQPVFCKWAVEQRDFMLEQLQLLPPVQAAMDQIIHHFGTDMVAEVTGRSRRIVKKPGMTGFELCVENRSGSANLSETSAFMDDRKRILIFSDAGGTGRSYHADLNSLNQRPRVHYLLEAGWKADTAIQGLGRSHRSNQKQPPLFRPVATDVRGEKRFLSTIARRLDSLGAITRGQRQTGGQGMFRPSDNLESTYARDSLRAFYSHLHKGIVPCTTLQQFQDATGLKIVDRDGTMLEDLPPISRFLNRVLALEIQMQNDIFAYFETLLETRIERAKAAGTFDLGLETITAESLTVETRQLIASNAATGAETLLLKIRQKDRTKPRTLDSLHEYLGYRGAVRLVNSKSKRAALQIPTSSLMNEDGTLEDRVRLLRPMESTAVPVNSMPESNWEPCDQKTFEWLWTEELGGLSEFTETSFHVMTGLLLPYWKRLPLNNPRVYRFTTDKGEALIGRLIPTEVLGAFTQDKPDLTPEEAWDHVLNNGILRLEDDLLVKRITTMHAPRIELLGFTQGQYQQLKAIGLFAETIAWKLRLFIPTGSLEGPPILAKLLRAHPIRSTTF
ncbi:MAG: strawberry notch family protein [Hyphomicrobium zavarzinii]|uniref:bifunctional class I SAM-dependent methyltransferase/DEAD/DEAH box helicase n=1 Tax=Hyphomicrobium zavarzinii TaxID=48292 RepID=UPI001A5A5ABA|nr:bifunctional class I SAM-dependent methyltransferase/DEAD/DEAH box helicase [Hyphomicrobium zavarzinii]MBL8845991.1 strawberry notch family protein [Hyphomicrobium zavarzinii]